MRRVLEDVEEGHRAVREAVDEDSLDLALEVVQHDECECEPDAGISRGKIEVQAAPDSLLHARVLKLAPDARCEPEHQGVDHERASVLMCTM